MTDTAVDQIVYFLERYRKNGPRPILWIGAGASAAAGYPTLAKLESLLSKALPGATETGFALIDRYLREYSESDLSNFLQEHLGTPMGPAPIHEAIARLVGAGVFGSLFTTNYDRLIELALTAHKIRYTTQVLEQNFTLQARQEVLLLKLHGDQGDWQKVVLSAASYAEFEASSPLLRQQLNIRLRTHPVVFVGCSLRDPRVLGWLQSLSERERKNLFASRVLITEQDWAMIPGIDQELLRQSNVQPVLVNDHAAITRTLQQVARRLAPLDVQELVFELSPTAEHWTIVGPTTESPLHKVPSPLRDAAFVDKLVRLRDVAGKAVVDGHPGNVALEAESRLLARELGARLAAVLFSDVARKQVLRRIHDKDRGRARLILQVRDPWDEHQRTLVEQALALPWELLMSEREVFAVERSDLDVVREILIEGAPEVPEPTGAFSVAVTIAAPEDQTALRYEDEALRLQQALLPLGQCIAFAELGTVDDLVTLAERMEPQALHFSGHGLPGHLIFEDELGCSQRLHIDELVSRLNTRLSQTGVQKLFPRLFFLASCHGVSGTATVDPDDESRAPKERESRALGRALGEGPSTAAALHRAGFAQVLGYFGPVSDALCTRAESVFYRALAQGKSTLQATNECRQSLREPLQQGDMRICYPLAWVQLALYHRGPDRPLALAGAPQSTVPQWRDMMSVSGLPVLQHGFIGRRAIQHEIRRKVRAQQRLLLLYGIGGVGKTALATQLLCKVLAHDDRDILILRCDEVREESEPILKLWGRTEERARELGVNDETLKRIRERTSEPAEGFERTVESLRQKQPQLVIYADNLEDLQVAPKDAGAATPIGTLRPGVTAWWKAMERLSKRGLVMASMRYRFDGPPDEAWVAVDPLRKADTERLVDTFVGLRQLGQDSKRKLLELCGGHPRTLEFVENLLRLQRRRSLGSTTALDAVLDHVIPTANTHVVDDLLLEELWECLSAGAQQQARMLSVLRRPGPAQVIESLGESCVELRDTSLLTQYRLLGDREGHPVWQERWGMLGVVSTFVRSKLDDSQRQAAHVSVGIALKAHVEGQGEARLWSDQEDAIHHLHAAGEGDLAWPLVQEFALRYREQAQYREAVALLESCEAAQTSGERLALALMLLGQMLGYLVVRAGDVAAMFDRAARLSETDATRAFILHEQGRMQNGQGNYKEAEALLRRSVAIQRQALGTTHLEYGASLHELGLVLEAQGRHKAAESLFRRSLAVHARVLGTTHPDYATPLRSLAGVLESQGRYEEAESLLHRCLAIKKKALGTAHPDYGASLHSLAGVLESQGNYEKAKSLLRLTLAIYEEALGTTHPDYGAALHNLAGVLSKQRKYAEAEELLRRSLAIDEKSLGVDHPHYSASLHALVGILSEEGKHAEMEGLLRLSLAFEEQALGPDNPSRYITLTDLALVLAQQGKLEAAVPMVERALSVAERTHGLAHHDVGRILGVLAQLYASQGLPLAASTARRAVDILESCLGRAHPVTKNARRICSALTRDEAALL